MLNTHYGPGALYTLPLLVLLKATIFIFRGKVEGNKHLFYINLTPDIPAYEVSTIIIPSLQKVKLKIK